jgi:hypothetical protein
MVTYEQIKKANDSIITTDIKGKAYSEVPQRIKAFRMCYPEGTIHTEMISNENGICIFKASVYDNGDPTAHKLLGVGHAYEKEGSTFINKTSYIENCETSAVGRALGMAGFGIDTSVASAEEVQNAMANQNPEKTEQKAEQTERKATPKQIEFLASKYTGENLTKLLKANNISTLEEMPMTTASNLIKKIKGEK